MNIDDIRGVSPEGCDCQVTFDSFEECLNLPPIAVGARDDEWPKFEVVGNEGYRANRFSIIELHEAKDFLIVLSNDIRDNLSATYANSV